MARSSKASFLGLLIVVGSASATTVGPIRGAPVAGRPLEVNIPFAVDRPTDRACASANVHYGKVAVPGSTLHVQGEGLKRNLLVTSRVAVNKPTVTVDVRVGCGPKAVARTFTLAAGLSTARSPRMAQPAARQAASALAVMSGPGSVALMTPREPLFPPAAEAEPRESNVRTGDAPASQELHQARTEAATAVAQLDAARRELAAVLDVERRTSQTLIDADHEVRDARSEVARMRAVLNMVATALALTAAGVIWFHFRQLAARRRTPQAQPAKEPTIVSPLEFPAEDKPLPVTKNASALGLQPQPAASLIGDDAADHLLRNLMKEARAET